MRGSKGTRIRMRKKKDGCVGWIEAEEDKYARKDEWGQITNECNRNRSK